MVQVIWWVTVKGVNYDHPAQLFYVIEADSEDEALLIAGTRLGVKTLEEVTSVEAVRST